MICKPIINIIIFFKPHYYIKSAEYSAVLSKIRQIINPISHNIMNRKNEKREKSFVILNLLIWRNRQKLNVTDL